MKVWRAIRLYAFWVVVFVLQKPLFMGWYRGLYDDASLGEKLSTMLHGLPLDLSMAGYLTALPLLLVGIAIWWQSKSLRLVARIWIGLSAFLVALTFILNAVLYDYWGFPLDSTPFFYFFSSPKDAFASAGGTTIVCGLVMLAILTWVLNLGACWAFDVKTFAHVHRRRSAHRSSKRKRRRWWATAATVVSALVLFLLIRGGVTVSSMNTGKAYFSEKAELNHAAVNPMFCLMESLAHQNDFASQYRFMSDGEASTLFAQLTQKGAGATEPLLRVQRPDIYIVILESFSSKLMKTLGGNGVAASLDSLAGEGVLFTHFYANSFRTDRGLVSILSGYPAQPTTSLMKYPRKTATLPSIAHELQRVGYGLRYYYGGDANFTNMRSYLVSQGFKSIVSDGDFPVTERLSKWGVHDHLVFNRLLDDVENEKKAGKPMLRVIQTSSSHEPFDVPFHKLDDERLNAFAYTDDCVGRFIASLRQKPSWEKTLVVIVPDHLGCYPPNISNLVADRYEIPLLMVGGAISAPRTIDVIGSQQDIAATLLAQLGIDHDDFTFSKDMLDPTAPHFAFFTVPDAFGMVTSENTLIYDNRLNQVVVDEGQKGKNLKAGKAYLQKLYDDIAKR